MIKLACEDGPTRSLQDTQSSGLHGYVVVVDCERYIEQSTGLSVLSRMCRILLLA